MYVADPNRYEKMVYNYAGASGLQLPAIGLGLWHNFGSVDRLDNQRAIVRQAFDLGITYFDLANNYGPEPGTAEENFGQILATDLKPYRDEILVSSKAGYDMWEGPYGTYGSRKSIINSANDSLRRLGLDYVDIFYSHRFDPNTDLHETAEALDQLVREGKALYIGISNYTGEQMAAITKIFTDLKTPFIVNQVRYNMFNRGIETDLLPVLKKERKAGVAFSPLSQGLLTDRYLNGIPQDSRANRSDSPFLIDSQVDQTLSTVKKLNDIAKLRGQTLAEMALSWDLRDPEMACVLIGASRPSQVLDNVHALDHLTFSDAELKEINQILAAQPQISWAGTK
ncbi:aldo/keto reductase [Levilactobacillus bambusae]|uniref:L-glyceraldehyde 3-phosphate reductase n=1 Tax=Levilactobacillus bambusae TaxID=2024736 RepID=A0A2V1N1D3_9LACO|nr:aldo/keto reductase [Levilactobacillus bambusae]PWG00186.1 L-glyceraldehyde 3-phosphate reductase [Levilactobacillus bambusae]